MKRFRDWTDRKKRPEIHWRQRFQWPHRKVRHKKLQHRVKLRSPKQNCDMTAYQTQDPFSSDFFEIERQRGPRIPVVTIY